MEKKMEEQVIYPKDLLFAAMYRWKAMAAVGLVLAILLGGFQLVKGLRNGTDSAAQAAYEEALAEYEAEKAPLENYVERCEAEVETQMQYMEDSLLLSLDPYAHYRGALRLYISTDYQIQPDKTYQTPDKTKYLLANYQSLLQSDSMVAALAETAGLEWQLMNEIYSVYYDADMSVLTVQISHNDQAMAENLINQTLEMVTDHRNELTQVIGEHEISVLYQDVNLIVDTAVTAAVRDNRNHLNYLKEELNKAQAELAALTPPVQPQSGNASLKKMIIFAVLGLIAGAAVVAVCAWFGHMESDKAYSARLLSIRTGVKILGTLRVTKFGFIDRLIRKWEGRDTADTQKKAALLACDIRYRFPEGKLLLTGTGSCEERAAIAQALAAAGVTVSDMGSILENSEAVEALGSADAVVLAERCGKAACTGVFCEMQTVADYGKALIGCVVLDG